MAHLSPEIIDQLNKQDPIDRISVAGRMIEEHRQAMAVLAQIRAEAVAELRDNGMTLAEIARHLNVTRQQVHRLEQSVAEGQ